MRTSVLGAAFGAAAATLTLAVGAFAQADADPGAPAPASPGVSIGAGSGGPAVSSTGTPVDEGAKAEDEADKKKSDRLPWRSTQLIFSQSATTQTVGIGDDYNSRNPTYEISFSFRPRYYVYDRGDHTVNLNAVMEVSQELTNSDYTTRQNEMLFGNTTLNAAYGYVVYKDESGLLTQLSVGPRVVFPTSKAAWRSGQRLQLGGGVSAVQAFPLAGSTKTWFPSASLTGSFYYMKPLQTATTGENEDFVRERTSVNAQSIASNQISAGARVNHQVAAMTAASFNVTQKLHLTGSYVWVMQWAYTFDETEVTPAGVNGMTFTANELEDATNFRVMPWFLVSLDYDLLREVSIGGGYFNMTNQIGEDAQRRNPLWSPDARVFFDITANLDQIYMTIAGKRNEDAAARANARARQDARIKTVLTAASY